MESIRLAIYSLRDERFSLLEWKQGRSEMAPYKDPRFKIRFAILVIGIQYFQSTTPTKFNFASLTRPCTPAIWLARLYCKVRQVSSSLKLNGQNPAICVEPSPEGCYLQLKCFPSLTSSYFLVIQGIILTISLAIRISSPQLLRHNLDKWGCMQQTGAFWTYGYFSEQVSFFSPYHTSSIGNFLYIDAARVHGLK